MTATAFDARWREAVDLGLAGWINLSAQGVWGDANSGPNLGSDWRAERQLDIQT